jgi:hypothetical protein
MSEGSIEMTRQLTGAVRSRRERSAGLIQRLQGADMSAPGRQDRLNAAMVAYETACREGNETAKDLADIEIDNVLSEARGDVGQTEGQPAPTGSGFDGGVRRAPGAKRPVPGLYDPLDLSPTALVKLAMQASARRRA